MKGDPRFASTQRRRRAQGGSSGTIGIDEASTQLFSFVKAAVPLILIVEDEAGASELLQLFLEAHGFRTAAAFNGAAALERVNSERPAVVVSDFMMPGMNGAELGVAIRQNPALEEVPFLFTSGTDEEVVRQSFGDYDGFLAKPYDLEEILRIIHELVVRGRKRA